MTTRLQAGVTQVLVSLWALQRSTAASGGLWKQIMEPGLRPQTPYAAGGRVRPSLSTYSMGN